MKNCIFILSLSFSMSAYANVKDSILHRINFHAQVVFFMPTGQFSAKNSNSYFLGQSKNGIGINPSVLARVYKNFHAGIYFNVDNFWLDKQKLQTQFIQNFKEQGYYTSASAANTEPISMVGAGIEFSCKYKTFFCDIEPYLNMGAAIISNNGDHYYRPTVIHRKKINNNFYEDISVSMGRTSYFFYPGIGIHFDKKINKIFYLTLGLQYNYGETGYNLTYEKKNFFGDTTQNSAHYTQHISSLSVNMGIQLRVFKAKRFRHK